MLSCFFSKNIVDTYQTYPTTILLYNISCALPVDPSCTDEAWKGQNTYLPIYIYIYYIYYIYIYVIFRTIVLACGTVSNSRTSLYKCIMVVFP